MAVRTDLLETGRWVETENGIEHELVIRVDGIGGNQWNRRRNALQASGAPAIGSPHPVEPTIRLLERTVDPLPDHTSAFAVTLRYGVPDDEEAPPPGQKFGPITWSGSTRTITESTTRDWRGEIMRVVYAGRPQIESIDSATGQIIITQLAYRTAIVTARADVDRPLLQLVGRRFERDDPERNALRYTNTVNRARWRGYDAQTALCEGIVFDRDAESDGWNVEYQIIINEQTWRYESVYTIGANVPLDASLGNGIAFHEVYEPVDFSPLQLS